MSTQVQFRRGTTANMNLFAGAVGEITVDTTKKVVVVHDGSTLGGNPMAPANNPSFTGTVTLQNALGVAHGGTGLTSLTASRIPYASATNTLGTSTNLTFDGGNLYVGQAGSNQVVATGDGSLEIARAAGDAYIDMKAATASDYDCRIQSVGSGSSAYLQIKTGQGTGTFNFDASGNLGIGTTSPSSYGKLAVRGYISSGGQNYSASFSDAVYSTLSVSHQSGIANFICDQAIGFYTSSTERMRIDSSGNLLVGTTSQVGSALTSISSGTATNTSYRPLSLQGGSRAIFGNRKTTSVSTTATVISSVNEWANLVLVFGTDGTNRFCDLVLWSIGTGTVNPISSLSASGTPAARTYSQSSSTLRVAMASGTYSVHVVELTLAEV